MVSTARLPALLAALCLAACGMVHAAECHVSRGAQQRLGLLRDLMASGRFITYEPTSLVVVNGKVQPASEQGIRQDLAALRPRFDGLVTYGAIHGLEALPAIAESLGFRALLVGVWDPDDAQELDAALAAARAHPKLVLGIVLGNEIVFRRSSSMQGLALRLHALHMRAPTLLLAASEPFHLFNAGDATGVLAESDVLLPNIHPIYQSWFKPGNGERQAAEFVRNVVGDLRRLYCGPVLVKETGEPSGPASGGYSAANQALFWQALRDTLPASRDAAFSYFAAYDLPWRAQDGGLESEAHWGLLDAQRHDKQSLRELAP
jgi:exo-beta-1,3-glucanase (GH17 family)